jgi:hypothetical protein
MAPEETSCAILSVDIFHRSDDAKPATSVFCELGVGGLEEDLDSVKRSNYCFGLCESSSANVQIFPWGCCKHTALPANPPATPVRHM